MKNQKIQYTSWEYEAQKQKNKGLALTSIFLYLYQRYSDRLIDIKCNPLYSTKISNQKQKKEYQNLAEYYLKFFIQNKCYHLPPLPHFQQYSLKPKII